MASEAEIRITLAELIIKRNNLIEVLGGIKQRKSSTNEQTMEILINEFQSKIDLVDKQMSRASAGLKCSVCHENLTLTDEVLICEWCGTPAHKAHVLSQIKRDGYCQACGGFLKQHVRGSIRTITHDTIQAYHAAISEKIHKLQIFFGDKIIAEAGSDTEIQCPECKRAVAKEWNFCRYCGARLEQSERQTVEMTVCPRCGKQIKTSWRFCKLCGFPLASLQL